MHKLLDTGDTSDRSWSSNVVAAVSGSAISALPVFLVAALAPQIRNSLHFSVTEFGAIIALYYLSAALGSIPLSRLTESVGAAQVMRSGGMLMALLLLLLSLFARNLPSLACLVALAGLTSSVLQPATNLFLIQRMPAARRGLAFGLKQAAVPVAVVLSGLAVPVLALTLGWRWTFAIMAVPALAASILIPHTRKPLVTNRRRSSAPPLSRQDVVYLVVLTTGFALGVASASALATFVVMALSAAGQDYAVAGITASLGGLVAATTRTLVGIQVDRRWSAPLGVVAVMLGLGAAAYGLLAIGTVYLDALLLPTFLLAFIFGWGWNGLFSLAIATQYTTQAARASAITAVGGRIGGVLGPFLFGIIVTNASYAWAWLLAACAAAIGALIIGLAQR